MRRLRLADDRGGALVVALIVITVVGLLAGVLLSYSYVSFANSEAVTDEGKRTYAVDGLTDGAIRALADNHYLGLEGYDADCFVPVEQLNGTTAGAVRCVARPGSGQAQPTNTASQPQQAVLALGTDAAEGITQAAGSTLRVRGDALAHSRFLQAAGASLTVEGRAAAATCATSGVATPPVVCPNPVAPPADPGWDKLNDSAMPSTYPTVQTPPACGGTAGGTVTLAPGTYDNLAALQATLNCNNRVLHFQPGIYHFAYNGELVFNAVGGTSIVAGTRTTPTSLTCNPDAQGVRFIFSGTSRWTVNAGSVDICAYEPRTTTTTQHVAIYGPTTSRTYVAQPTSPSTYTVGGAATGDRDWINVQNSLVPDGNAASADMTGNSSSTRNLTLSGFGLTNGTGWVTVTITLYLGMSGPGGAIFASATTTSGNTGMPSLLSCPSADCDGTIRPYTLSLSTNAAHLSTLTVNIDASKWSPGPPLTPLVDGVTVSGPGIGGGSGGGGTIAAVGGALTAAPYDPASAARAPLLQVAGSSTVFQVHGTVYAPTAVVDLRHTNATYTVVDRGIVVRHLHAAMAGGGSEPHIAIPPVQRLPRVVYLETRVNGRTELLGEVVLDDTAGSNGGNASVQQWSHQR